jgi:hypothetical protein
MRDKPPDDPVQALKVRALLANKFFVIARQTVKEPRPVEAKAVEVVVPEPRRKPRTNRNARSITASLFQCGSAGTPILYLPRNWPTK